MSKYHPYIIAICGAILSFAVAWGGAHAGDDRDHAHLLDIEKRTRSLEQTVPVIANSLEYLKAGEDEINHKLDVMHDR